MTTPYDVRDDTNLIVEGNTDRVLRKPCRSGAYFYLYGYFLKDSALIGKQNPASSYPAYVLSMSDPRTVPDDVIKLNWE